MQRAEQAIGDQASYMGKDNLQRTTSKVSAPTDRAYTVTVKYRCWMKQEHTDEYWIFVLFFHAGQRYQGRAGQSWRAHGGDEGRLSAAPVPAEEFPRLLRDFLRGGGRHPHG